ncbi:MULTISPECIES: hypothetical protein [unclassified Vibrio]|nr:MULTISPECIES: hypothetical protein [unclassified Vibrio]
MNNTELPKKKMKNWVPIVFFGLLSTVPVFMFLVDVCINQYM